MKRKDFSKLAIEVQQEKSSYFEHEDFIAGTAPNLRGIYSTMYFNTPLETIVLNEPIKSESYTPAIELANFLTESFYFIQQNIKKNTSIDSVISQLSFQTTISSNHFDEIAKMRAVRLLWAKMIQLFNPKSENSYKIKIHAIINNSIDASVGILGGCQSLASTETIHLFYEEETYILKTIDPWAGSTYLEKRTEEIAIEAWSLFIKETTI
jgi:methylmalonyl-CoA mutase